MAEANATPQPTQETEQQRMDRESKEKQAEIQALLANQKKIKDEKAALHFISLEAMKNQKKKIQDHANELHARELEMKELKDLLDQELKKGEELRKRLLPPPTPEPGSMDKDPFAAFRVPITVNRIPYDLTNDQDTASGTEQNNDLASGSKVNSTETNQHGPKLSSAQLASTMPKMPLPSVTYPPPGYTTSIPLTSNDQSTLDLLLQRPTNDPISSAVARNQPTTLNVRTKDDAFR